MHKNAVEIVRNGIFKGKVNIFSRQIYDCLKKNAYLCTDYR